MKLIKELYSHSRCILKNLKYNLKLNLSFSPLNEGQDNLFLYYTFGEKAICRIFNLRQNRSSVIDMPSSSSSVLSEIFNQRQYLEYLEEVLKRLTKRFKRKKFRILDIGASFGAFTVLFNRFLPAHSNPKFILFEPFPENIKFLKRNMSKNNVDNFEIIDNIVFKKAEIKKKLYYTSSLTSPTIERDQPTAKKSDNYLSKKTITIDSLNLDKVGLIKIDIEGAEEHALEGAEKTIRESQPIIMCSFEHPTNNKNKIIKIVNNNSNYEYRIDKKNKLLYFFPKNSP